MDDLILHSSKICFVKTHTLLMLNISFTLFPSATVQDLPLPARALFSTSVSPPSTTCIHAATKWLKSSVQIQMSDLFVFVCREPFLSGTSSICETQSEELFICLGCSPALLCSCPSHQPPFASPHCAVVYR